jgi:tetratricopeptide (TPR) repeat protein
MRFRRSVRTQNEITKRAATLKPVGRGEYADAISLFERALAFDPHSSEAQGWLAENLAGRALDEMADAAAADIPRAAGLAAQAVAASPRSAFAHVAKGRVLSAQGRYGEAIPEYEAARAINPSWPHPYGWLGECKLWTGSMEDTIPLVEQAVRICSGGSFTASWDLDIARVHLMQSHTNEAIVWLEKARSAGPQLPSTHAWLAAASALNGEIGRAAAELAQARGLSRDGRYLSHPFEGHRTFRRAEDPRLARKHLFQWPAKGRHAGGVTARVGRFPVKRLR